MSPPIGTDTPFGTDTPRVGAEPDNAEPDNAEPDDTEAHSPGLLVLVTRLARQVYQTATESVLGMELKQFSLLNHLREDSGVPQQQLGENLCLGANHLVLLLNAVEAAGWAERRRDPADRRRHLVHRTAAGTAAVARAEKAMDSVEDRVLGQLSPAERSALRALLVRAFAD
jgi:DNA-binding MarR family transcriptional regulator